MLYALTGTDTQRTREKMHTLVALLQKKKPDAEYFRIDAETFSPAGFDALIQGQGLFERKYIVVFDNVLSDPVAEKNIIGFLERMTSSDNVFIILEDVLSVGHKKKIEKNDIKIETHNAPKKKQTFNVFSLTDAIGARDKLKTWILYQEALAHRVTPEEVHGIVFWYFKTLILAKTSASAEEVNMKPFVYNKAKKSSDKYSLEELHARITDLVRALSESRKGADLETGLERIFLSL